LCYIIKTRNIVIQVKKSARPDYELECPYENPNIKSYVEPIQMKGKPHLFATQTKIPKFSQRI
jgi:hypothetical protein